MRRVSPVPTLRPSTALRGALSRPRVRLSFFTAAGEYSAKSGVDPMLDLVSVQTQKARAGSNQPGKWTAVLTYRQGTDGETWASRINAMDGCLIEMVGDFRKPLTTTMLGLVDSVSVNASAGAPTATVTISGSDMGKVLTKSRADFYANVRSVNVGRQYATATTTAQALTSPTTSATVVGTLSTGQVAPVLSQSPGWTQILLPAGGAWIPSSNVTITETEDPYATTLLDNIEKYSQAVSLGNATVQGVTSLMLSLASQNQSKPWTASADPSTLIALTLLAWTFRTMNIRWNVQGRFVGLPDTLRFLLTQLQYGLSTTTAALSPMQGDVWSFFESFANEPLYELFLDTRPNAEIDAGQLLPLTMAMHTSSSYDGIDGATVPGGVFWGDDQAKAVLVYRRAPFDPADWENLVIGTIDDLEVANRSVSKGDSDVINMYWPYPDLGNQALQPYADTMQPLVDAGSAVRYGLQTARFPIRGMSTDTNPDWLMAYQDMADDLWRWYRDNPLYWNGTIALGNGRPEIKVGQRVLDSATGLSYYVEGVQNSWQLTPTGGAMNTSLQVSRGAYRGA